MCDCYPSIMGHWKTIEDTYYHTKWECPTCGETFSSRKSHNFDTKVQSIKDGRKQYSKQLLQPYRDGEFSKEYRDAYPDKAKEMVKEGVISQQQHDKAKEVWGKDIY